MSNVRRWYVVDRDGYLLDEPFDEDDYPEAEPLAPVVFDGGDPLDLDIDDIGRSTIWDGLAEARAERGFSD